MIGKRYIGDSIYLDPQMIDELVEYYEDAKRAATEAQR